MVCVSVFFFSFSLHYPLIYYFFPLYNPDTPALCDAALRGLNQGAVIQLERKGFFRVDSPFISGAACGGGADRPAMLFSIPDGKQGYSKAETIAINAEKEKAAAAAAAEKTGKGKGKWI